jgi:hypothetical protein
MVAWRMQNFHKWMKFEENLDGIRWGMCRWNSREDINRGKAPVET